jgi:cyclase
MSPISHDPATHASSGAPARFPGGLRELAPRTWAWLQPNGGLGESNAGLVVPDGDHWWGNAVLDRSVEICATAACDRAMRAEALPRVLDGMTRTAALARRVPGRPGAVARYGHAQLAPFAWRGVRLRHADRTVEGGTLDVGGRAAHVHDLGPTHSAADAVVHLPDVGVVFAGDLLFIGVTPIMWQGPIETWIAALDALVALDAGVYVPGHGPPCGRAELEQLADYWRWLRDGVREQRAAGRSPGEAARELLRSPEHARWAHWQNPERIVVSIATAYRNLDGASVELSPPARAGLLLQMWRVGAELTASAGP